MKRIKAILILLLFIGAATGLFSQVTAVLSFYENQSQISIVDKSTGFNIDVYYGMDLKVGYEIKTVNTTAELELKGNGTIMKLGKNTVFRVGSLANTTTKANSFYLDIGTLRTIAAKITNGQSYSYITGTAVCGVRGTDFTMVVSPGKKDATYVNSGKVDFTHLNSGKTVGIGPGMFADVYGSSFSPAKMPSAMKKQLFDNFKFKKLNPNNVPGHKEELASLGDDGADSGDSGSDSGSDSGDGADSGPDGTDGSDGSDGSGGSDGGTGGDFFGMKLGSTVIDGVTYNQFVAMPEFELGDLKLGLYLPLTFTNNMLDPADRYKPGGNDEWSFGTDKTDPLDIAWDAIVDTVLKIKYISYGDNHDDFFFKVGSIPSMTLGSGVIMKEYANDTDFPTIRKIGFDVKYTLDGFGIEGLVADISTLDLFAVRPYLIPFGDMEIGLSTVVDLNPAAELTDKVGDPILVAAGLGFDTPIINLENFLELYLYAEGAAMMPIFRAADAAHGISAGPAWATVWDGGPRNYALEVGVDGTILSFLDYNVAYKQWDGYFSNQYFDASYDRVRAQKVHEIADYMLDPTDSEFDMISGLYGEASATIMDKIHFTAGYLFPMKISTSGLELGEHDKLIAKLEVDKGLIPDIDLAGAVTLIRNDMFITLLSNASSFHFFDYNTVLEGELSYGFSDNVDMAFVFSLVPDGIDETTGIPYMKPSITLETRVHL